MNNNSYLDIVKKHSPKEKVFKNSIIAFIVGGFMGLLGEVLTEVYYYLFDISNKDASTLMIITLIFLGCLFTALGFFDELVRKTRCGLIIPITGFAHAIMSATLDYKNEGLVNGIGSNMFKLAGSVIVYGVISAYVFGLIRLLVCS